MLFVRNDCNFIFTVTTGHETVMAKTTFFSTLGDLADSEGFDFTRDYPYQEQLMDLGGELGKVREYSGIEC